MIHRRFILAACLLLTSCNAQKSDTSNPALDIQEAASSWRYETPEGTVEAQNLTESMKITLTNRFPIWRDSIHVNIDVSIKNLTKSHLSAIGLAKLYIYSFDEKKPIYWANVDLAFSEPMGPNVKNVVSVPVGASDDRTISIEQMRWAPVDQKIWPDAPLYSLIPTGKYLMRFEFELYEEDNNIGIAVSNFIQFSSIQTAPEVHIPQGI